MQSQLSQSRIIRSGVEFALIFGLVLAVQSWQGAFYRDFASHPDEAGHFVTGAMVHDYLLSGFGKSPMDFAEAYYARYPKVGLGHWPPGFYALQGVWYVCCGVSKQAATLLVGLLTAGLAWCLYRDLVQRHSTLIAVATLAVFFGQPLIRNHIMLIMSDVSTCLATLLAVFAFRDFIGKQRNWQAAAFVFWSSLAILMKPSALSLALFVPMYLLLSGRHAAFANWKLWLAGTAIGLLTAPWYVWAWNSGMGLHGQGSVARMAAKGVGSLIAYYPVAILVLLICVLSFVMISGRYAIFTSWKWWLAGTIVGLSIATWYVWMGNTAGKQLPHGSFSQFVSREATKGTNNLAVPTFVATVSWPLIAVAFLGVIRVLSIGRGTETNHQRSYNTGLAAIALTMATIIFLAAAPFHSAPRYLLPALIGLLILYAHGVEAISDLLQKTFRGMAAAQRIIPIAMCGLCIAAIASAPGADKSTKHIYADASASISNPSAGRVILISSHSGGGGANGEGAFIVERLLGDRERTEFVLRASKVLSQSSWSGQDYHLIFSTPEEVRDFLHSAPVHLIVLDEFIQDRSIPSPHHQMLKTVLTNSPEQFPLAFNSSAGVSQREGSSIHIYRNLAVRSGSVTDLEIDMKRSLGRTIPIDPQPRHDKSLH